GTVSHSYSSGSVTGGDNSALLGGLVGVNDGTVSHSFWDTVASGRPMSDGGTGKTTAEMKQLATFQSAGWDIDDAGGTGGIWRIYEGNSYPLLRGFLQPLTVTAVSGMRAYDGTTAGLGVTYSVTPNANLLGTPTVTASGKDVGTRTLSVSGLFSNQQGYDISYVSGTLTITPKPLSISGTTVANKVYDGTTVASVTPGTLSGLVGSETLGVAASGSFADKNAGTGKSVTVSYTLSDGANGGLASNYTLAGETKTADITAKSLTASYSAQNKVYDGTTTASVTATSGDIVAGDTVAISASGAFNNKHVGTGKVVSITGGALSGADAGNYVLVNPTGSATADITARPLLVAADPKSKFVGQADPALTYTSGCPAPLSVNCGLVSGETLAGTLTRSAGEAVGSYPILQGTVTSANNPNYAIVYQGANLTIEAVEPPGAPANARASAQQTSTTEVERPLLRLRLLQELLSRIGGRAGIALPVIGTGIRLPEGIEEE
ncbi:MAG: YDG domain-containing protein, partial [Casimicrobiaceae bacterium]|nr:YDG domain-containing protein [Casimicrobiaceae bacterium]